MLHEGCCHGGCILVLYFGQHDIPRLAFDERRNIAVVSAANEIAFPMPRDCAIFHGSGPVLNRDGIGDFPQSLVLQTRLLRAANGSLGSETGLQLLLQDASGLNIEAAIDGLVGHACVFSIRDSVAATTQRFAGATTAAAVWLQRPLLGNDDEPAYTVWADVRDPKWLGRLLKLDSEHTLHCE